MTRLLLFALAALLGGCASTPAPPVVVDPAQLPVLGGTLTADTTLAGDYLLASDLQVPEGLTLTISPGSRIYVQPSDSTKIDPEFLSREVELLVRGRLLALGSAEQPIRFIPLAENRDDILWAGIELVASQGSRLQHLSIEQAETGLLCLGSSPQVESLRILRSRYGVILQQNSAPQISDSLLADGEGGLFCWDRSAPLLEKNHFVRLQEEGIYLGPKCQAKLVGNLIQKTDRALVLPAGETIATDNRLVDNRQDFVRYSQDEQQ